MDWRSRWSSQLPSADLRIDALPFGSAWVIGTSHALSQYGAVVLYEDCVLWLEDVIKRHVDRLAVVNAFPAGRPMALPAPTKSIVFLLLRNSTLVTNAACHVASRSRVLSSYTWSVLHSFSCFAHGSRLFGVCLACFRILCNAQFDGEYLFIRQSTERFRKHR